MPLMQHIRIVLKMRQRWPFGGGQHGISQRRSFEQIQVVYYSCCAQRRGLNRLRQSAQGLQSHGASKPSKEQRQQNKVKVGRHAHS
jgi:hypothetical protein